MQQQGIPALDLVCIATRKQKQAPVQAKRYSRSKRWTGHTIRPSQGKRMPDAGAMKVNTAPTFQYESSNGRAQSCESCDTARQRHQQGPKSGMGVPGDMLLFRDCSTTTEN